MRRILMAAAIAVFARGAVAGELALPKGVTIPQFFERQGIKVLMVQKGPGALNVWQVERNGVRTVFYTTPDNRALISGVVWDAATGVNLSDVFITADMKAAAQGGATGEPEAYSPDRVPKAIVGIDKLVGVKEGAGAMDKTLYIMFDPRCPHCHNAYKRTRQFVAKGATIKWIPVTVLGRRDEGILLVADILQSSNPLKSFALAMTTSARGGAQRPSPETIKAVSDSEEYFFAAFDRNKAAGQAGVPVAFYMDSKGVPQMIAGVDDEALLQQIFASMKK